MRSLVAALALFVALDAAAQNCLPQWSEGKRITFGHIGVVAGDFNGDGLTDLVSYWTTSVTLRLTVAGATPHTATTVFTTEYVSEVRVADVQNDGKPDIVIGDKANNSITVLPGNGDGTFAAAITTPVQISPTRIVVDDFNGDDLADVAFSSYSANAFAVWAGNGAGAFTQLAQTPIGFVDPQVRAIGAGDLDGDGFADLLTTYFGSTLVEVRFGNGNGTFAAPLSLTGGNYGTSIAVGDFDDDGDLDFATSDNPDSTITVFRNNGSRAFAVPVAYPAAYPIDVAAADVTGDGVLDLVSALRTSYVATHRGNGDGTFGDAVLVRTEIPGAPGYVFTPDRVVPGNFDGNAGLDVVLADSWSPAPYVGIWTANCRVAAMELTITHPVVSLGDDAPMTVTLTPLVGELGTDYPVPTGTVRLYENDAELASATLAGGVARFTLTGLSEGDHAIRAEYDGDVEYDGKVVGPFTQTITADTTTTTIATPSASYSYGASMTFTATVTASNGGALSGSVALLKDGVPWESRTLSGSSVSIAPWGTDLDPGTYTFRTRYLGSATQPPSTSDPIAITIRRAESTFVQLPYAPVSRPGETQLELLLVRENNPYVQAGGAVTLWEGDTPLDTQTLSGNRVTFTPSLAAGTHYLRVSYEGDARYLPASMVLRHDVVPASPFTIVAMGGPTLYVRWAALAGASSYRVMRRVNGVWMQIATTSSPGYAEYNPQAGAYVYRVDAVTGGGAIVSSNVVLTMNATFTDDPVMPGKPVRALHVNELVSAANALRTAAGLPPIALAVTPGQTILASHVQQLRDAIQQARAALQVPAVSFTDPVLTTATPFRMLHIQQLRDAMR